MVRWNAPGPAVPCCRSLVFLGRRSTVFFTVIVALLAFTRGIAFMRFFRGSTDVETFADAVITVVMIPALAIAGWFARAKSAEPKQLTESIPTNDKPPKAVKA